MEYGEFQKLDLLRTDYLVIIRLLSLWSISRLT